MLFCTTITIVSALNLFRYELLIFQILHFPHANFRTFLYIINYYYLHQHFAVVLVVFAWVHQGWGTPAYSDDTFNIIHSGWVVDGGGGGGHGRRRGKKDSALLSLKKLFSTFHLFAPSSDTFTHSQWEFSYSN